MNPYLHQEPNKQVWALVLVATVVGIATGFSVPLLASYRPNRVLDPQGMERNDGKVIEIVPTPAQPFGYDVARDSEVEALATRNRRLEALVATLRKEKVTAADKAKKNHKTLDELGSRQ